MLTKPAGRYEYGRTRRQMGGPPSARKPRRRPDVSVVYVKSESEGTVALTRAQRRASPVSSGGSRGSPWRGIPLTAAGLVVSSRQRTFPSWRSPAEAAITSPVASSSAASKPVVRWLKFRVQRVVLLFGAQIGRKRSARICFSPQRRVKASRYGAFSSGRPCPEVFHYAWTMYRLSSCLRSPAGMTSYFLSARWPPRISMIKPSRSPTARSRGAVAAKAPRFLGRNTQVRTVGARFAPCLRRNTGTGRLSYGVPLSVAPRKRRRFAPLFTRLISDAAFVPGWRRGRSLNAHALPRRGL